MIAEALTQIAALGGTNATVTSLADRFLGMRVGTALAGTKGKDLAAAYQALTATLTAGGDANPGVHLTIVNALASALTDSIPFLTGAAGVASSTPQSKAFGSVIAQMKAAIDALPVGQDRAAFYASLVVREASQFGPSLDIGQSLPVIASALQGLRYAPPGAAYTAAISKFSTALTSLQAALDSGNGLAALTGADVQGLMQAFRDIATVAGPTGYSTDAAVQSAKAAAATLGTKLFGSTLYGLITGSEGAAFLSVAATSPFLMTANAPAALYQFNAVAAAMKGKGTGPNQLLEMALAELASGQGRSDESVEMSLDFSAQRLADKRTTAPTTLASADLLASTDFAARRAAIFNKMLGVVGVPSETFLKEINDEIADVLQVEANNATYKLGTARALYGQSVMARLGLALEGAMLPEAMVDDLSKAYSYAINLSGDELSKVRSYLAWRPPVNNVVTADSNAPARPLGLTIQTEKIIMQLFGGSVEQLRSKGSRETIVALIEYRKALGTGQDRLKGGEAAGSLYSLLAVMATGAGAAQAEGDVQNLLILQAFTYLAYSVQLPIHRIAAVYQSYMEKTANTQASIVARINEAQKTGSPIPWDINRVEAPSLSSMLAKNFSSLIPELTTADIKRDALALYDGRKTLYEFGAPRLWGLAGEGENKLRTGQKLSQSIGQNGIFVIADLLSLAGSIYNIVINQKNGADATRTALDVVGGLVPSTVFLAADVLDTVASGTKVLRAVMGMNVAGIVISIGTSTYQIYDAVKKFEADRDDVSSQAYVAQSVINTTLALGTLAAMVVAPPIGLIVGALSAILPNFAAAAASIEYMNKGHELAKKGLDHDAAIMFVYQQDAGLEALSAIGFVAKFLGANPIKGMKRLVQADSSYYRDATMERLHWGLVGDVQANGRSALVNSLLDNMGSQYSRVRYLLGGTDTFNYFAGDTQFTNSIYSVQVSKAADGTITVADGGNGTGKILQVESTWKPVWFSAADFARTSTGDGPELVLIDRDSSYLGTMNIEAPGDGKSRIYNVLTNSVALTGKNNGDSFLVSGSNDVTVKIAAQTTPYTDQVFIRPPDAKVASKGVAIQLDNYVNVLAVHGTPGDDTVTGTAKEQLYDSRGGKDIVTMSGAEARVNVVDSQFATVTIIGQDAVVYGNSSSDIRMNGANGFVAVDLTRTKTQSGYGTLRGSSDDALKVSAAEGHVIELRSDFGVGLRTRYRDPSYNVSYTGMMTFDYAAGWFGTYISDEKNTNEVTLTGHTFKAFAFGAGDEILSLTNAGEVFTAMGDGSSTVRFAGDTTATLTTGTNSSFTLTLDQTAAFTGYLQGSGTVNINGVGSDNSFMIGGGGTVSIAANQGQALYLELADAEGNGKLGGVVNLTDTKRGVGAAVTINLQDVESERITVHQVQDGSGKMLQIQTWKSDPTTLKLGADPKLNLVETVNYRGTESLGNAYLAWTDASDGKQNVISLATLVQSLATFGVAGGGATFGHSGFLANDVATISDLALSSIVAQTVA